MVRTKKRYHMVRKQQADTKALLRALVSGYLLWLAWKLASTNAPDLPQAARYLAGGLFAAGAIVFGLFAWRRYQTDITAAELTPEEEEMLRQNQDP